MCELEICTSKNAVCLDQAIADVIESIALEEVGIANVINAEGCKIKKAIELATTVDELVTVNKSVKSTLDSIIKSQMLLNFKLEEIAEIGVECKFR